MKDGDLVIDEVVLDELVSGQLSGQRYREVLKALDRNPEQWRACALAFLEDQALRSELRELAKAPRKWTSDEDSATTAPANATDNLAIAVQAPQNARPSGGASNWTSHFLSTAALLLVSFTVGWWGSELIADREQSVGPAPVSSDVANAQRPAPATNNPAPIFVGNPGGFVPLDSRIPPTFRELERQGKVRLESTIA